MRGAIHAGFALVAAAAGRASAASMVWVVLDMDTDRAGFQSVVDVPPGTTVVAGVGVYIYAFSGDTPLLSIGFLGGLDRGIALGHSPSPANHGTVIGITGHVGTPVNPGNTGFVFPPMQPGFAGPEVQYIEYGAAAPANIAVGPGPPAFTADIHLNGAEAGDDFRIAVLDLVTIWLDGGGGAFSPSALAPLTCGGDAAHDLTVSVAGVDADVRTTPGLPYAVDYVDGGLPLESQIGGGRIRVGAGCYANCDSSTVAPALNVADFMCFMQSFAAGDRYSNCDGSTLPPILNVADFNCFLQQFAAGCP